MQNSIHKCDSFYKVMFFLIPDSSRTLLVKQLVTFYVMTQPRL